MKTTKDAISTTFRPKMSDILEMMMAKASQKLALSNHSLVQNFTHVCEQICSYDPCREAEVVEIVRNGG